MQCILLTAQYTVDVFSFIQVKFVLSSSSMSFACTKLQKKKKSREKKKKSKPLIISLSVVYLPVLMTSLVNETLNFENTVIFAGKYDKLLQRSAKA